MLKTNLNKPKNNSNNIAVDPTFKCHAERSRSIYFKRGLRSFTSVQDDKFAKKNELRVNIYIIAKIIFTALV